MSTIDGAIASQTKRLARRILHGSLPEDLADELIQNRVSSEPQLVPLYEAMSEEQALVHFREKNGLTEAHLRNGVRYFHAWRVDLLRRRIGEELATASILDVGDSDGLMLKHLGKHGLGFNLSPEAINRIESNGIEARLGDGQALPFDANTFDYVLCFETLEHVESPAALLAELSRVCKPSGRVFISIPWVPRTFVHARHTDTPRGDRHIFEFSRDDFVALLTHTPLTLTWESVCDLFGEPSRPAQRALLAVSARRHTVAGMFRRFQFFELQPTS